VGATIERHRDKIGSGIRTEPLRVIDEFRYRTPAPNKMASMLLSLQGSDAIGVAETGSGKEADVAASSYVRLRVILLIGECAKSALPYKAVRWPIPGSRQSR
jgi:hypothetical protein